MGVFIKDPKTTCVRRFLSDAEKQMADEQILKPEIVIVLNKKYSVWVHENVFVENTNSKEKLVRDCDSSN